ncbi:D-alanine--D-alanine ligase [[Clostridium] ultunense Esp]|nr:D-alanine--D-alanine ligase [[Clostridium] ultunense Esp]
MKHGKKIRIALLYGGKSGEHEVSLLSARSILAAIDREKYEPIPIGISKEGRWLPREESLKLLGIEEIQGYLEEGNSDRIPLQKNQLLSPAPVGEIQPISFYFPGDVDVIFPVLHGPNGEDGTVQGLLQLADLPYVGAGVLSSAVGMDKVIMKRLFAQADLPQAKYLSFLRKDLERRLEEVVQEIEEVLGYPCFVKPANLGSSVGISKAKDRNALQEALSLAARYDRKIIVEEYIPAREIELGVLGNDDPIASIPGEILPGNEFYDYEAKYFDGKSQLVIPAKVTEEEKERLQELAIQAFKAIDGAGLARVDFFIHKDTGEILVNEINTMPGFTPYSMYPLLWQHSGIPYRELIDRLIDLALKRYEEGKSI